MAYSKAERERRAALKAESDARKASKKNKNQERYQQARQARREKQEAPVRVLNRQTKLPKNLTATVSDRVPESVRASGVKTLVPRRIVQSDLGLTRDGPVSYGNEDTLEGQMNRATYLGVGERRPFTGDLVLPRMPGNADMEIEGASHIDSRGRRVGRTVLVPGRARVAEARNVNDNALDIMMRTAPGAITNTKRPHLTDLGNRITFSRIVLDQEATTKSGKSTYKKEYPRREVTKGKLDEDTKETVVAPRPIADSSVIKSTPKPGSERSAAGRPATQEDLERVQTGLGPGRTKGSMTFGHPDIPRRTSDGRITSEGTPSGEVSPGEVSPTYGVPPKSEWAQKVDDARSTRFRAAQAEASRRMSEAAAAERAHSEFRLPKNELEVRAATRERQAAEASTTLANRAKRDAQKASEANQAKIDAQYEPTYLRNWAESSTWATVPPGLRDYGQPVMDRKTGEIVTGIRRSAMFDHGHMSSRGLTMRNSGEDEGSTLYEG